MRRFVVAALGCSLAWCLIGSVAFAQGPKFNDKRLSNNYSFRLEGAQSGSSTACPVSADGVLSFNGHGSVTSGTILYNDCVRAACTGNLTSGTYAVNSDASGSLTLVFDASGCSTSIALGLNIALFKLGKQAYLSGQSATPLSAVLTGELSLQKSFP